MKKKRKHVLFYFQPMDYKAMEEYFEEMAAKGWMLERMKAMYLTFRACKPARLKFTVDIFPEISLFEGQGKQEAREYREFCERAGWNFVTSFTKFQVFCAPKEEELVPIQTDEEVERKLVQKSFWGSELYLAALAILYILIKGKEYLHFPYRYLFSNFSMVLYLIFPLFVLVLSLMPADYFYTLWRAKRDIKKHRPVRYRNLRQAKRLAVVELGVLAIGIALMILAALAEGKIGIVISGFVPVMIGLLVGICYRQHVEKSEAAVSENVLKFIGVLVAVAVMAMVTTTLFISARFGREAEREEIGLPTVLTLEEVGKPAGQAEAELKRSLLAPVQYGYNERSSAGESSLRVLAYRTASVSLARYLYREIAADYFDRMEGRMEAAPWPVDQGICGDLGGVRAALVQQDNVVIYLLTDGQVSSEQIQTMLDRFVEVY